MPDVRALYRGARLDLGVLPIPASAAALPVIDGRRRVVVSSELPMAARPFVALHELVHIVEGHGEELEYLELGPEPYPMEDRIADAVAAIGVTSESDRNLAPVDLAELLRQLVPVDAVAWRIYRSAAVASLIAE